MKKSHTWFVGFMVVLLAFILCLMAFTLTACGKEAAEPEQTSPAESGPELIDEIPEDDMPAPMPEITKRDLAETMVGEPLADLIDMIGEPLSSDYAPSCLGPGEDGELRYEDFIVYTYREGDMETVEEIYNAK